MQYTGIALTGKGREILIAIGVGVAFMVIALIPQVITQELPSIIFVIKYGLSKGIVILSKLEFSNPLIYSLFIGGSAAVYQEIFKYFAVGTQSRYLAIWVGVGFALVDVTVLFIEVSPSLQIVISSLFATTTVLNVVFSLLFHPGTAMILKYARSVGKGIYFLLFVIFLHGVVDGGLIFTDIFILKDYRFHYEATAVFWAIAITISVVSFLLGLRYIKKITSMRQVEQSPW